MHEMSADAKDPGGTIRSVLAHVGTVRSEMLVFSILACVLLNAFAAINIAANGHHADFMDLAMKGAGIVVLFLGLGFYIYAYLNQPSSAQERVFVEQALPEIAKTKRAVRTARAGAV